MAGVDGLRSGRSWAVRLSYGAIEGSDRLRHAIATLYAGPRRRTCWSRTAPSARTTPLRGARGAR